MVKINDLISSVSNMLYQAVKDTKFNVKITDDENQRQLYADKDVGCFFIDVHIGKSKSRNLHFNTKDVEISINYYPQSVEKKRDLYDLKDILDTTFTRSIVVGKRYLHIQDITDNIMRDDIGYWLNYTFNLSYAEQVYFEVHDRDTMGSVDVALLEEIRVESEV